MTAMNELVVLAERPTTIIEPQTCRLETAPIPEIADGEALVQVGWLSIDPTIRTWMDDAPGYLPPIGIGDVVRSGGIGTIIESKSDRYRVGDALFEVTQPRVTCYRVGIRMDEPEMAALLPLIGRARALARLA